MEEIDTRIISNAGRCDICGKPIDMSSGDSLVTCDFTAEPEWAEEHGVTDQQIANGIANALERVGDSGAEYELARVIREEHEYKVHKVCIDETNYSKLETEADN